MIKQVMDRAGIEPGSRDRWRRPKDYGMGVACVLNKIPIHHIRDWLGHANSSTTEIDTTVIGQDQREMLMGVWQGEKSL